MMPVPYSPPAQPSFATVSSIGSLYTWTPTNALLPAGLYSSRRADFEVLFPNAQRALSELFRSDPLFSSFALSVLKLREKDLEEPEEDAPATAFAISQVFYLVPQSRLALSQAWTKPLLITDGYGGLRMNWSKNGRDVRVSIPGVGSGKRVLYWEEGDSYGSVADVTPTGLTKYLRWITDGAGNITE
jgi:hypothetical protein